MFIDRRAVDPSVAPRRSLSLSPTQELPGPDYETIITSGDEDGDEDASSVDDDFDYTAFTEEMDLPPRPVSRASNVPQRTTYDIDITSSDDESVDHTTPTRSRFRSNSPTHRDPTPEPYLSEYEDSGTDSASASDAKWSWRNRTRFNSNPTPEPNTHSQFDPDTDSSDSDSDSESEDEGWTLPPPPWNNTPPLPPSPLKLREAYISYDQRWTTLFAHKDQLTFHLIPWPQYPPPSTVLEINMRSIREFLRIPALAGNSTFLLKTTVRQALLRFHPDKTALLLARVEVDQRRAVIEGCTAVARCLNEIKENF